MQFSSDGGDKIVSKRPSVESSNAWKDNVFANKKLPKQVLSEEFSFMLDCPIKHRTIITQNMSSSPKLLPNKQVLPAKRKEFLNKEKFSKRKEVPLEHEAFVREKFLINQELRTPRDEVSSAKREPLNTCVEPIKQKCVPRTTPKMSMKQETSMDERLFDNLESLHMAGKFVQQRNFGKQESAMKVTPGNYTKQRYQKDAESQGFFDKPKSRPPKQFQESQVLREKHIHRGGLHNEHNPSSMQGYFVKEGSSMHPLEGGNHVYPKPLGTQKVSIKQDIKKETLLSGRGILKDVSSKYVKPSKTSKDFESVVSNNIILSSNIPSLKTQRNVSVQDKFLIKQETSSWSQGRLNNVSNNNGGVVPNNHVRSFNEPNISLKKSRENDKSLLKLDGSTYDAITSEEWNTYRKGITRVIDLYNKTLNTLQLNDNKKGKAAASTHVETAMILKDQHEWLNTTKRIGPIPGVKVGDKFQWRAQLNVIGLHCQFSSGIDYMTRNGKILATSIVDSNRYDNNSHFIEDFLIYSGQGGNPYVKGNGVKPEDQVMEKGNLALKNCIKEQSCVRVIRGHCEKKVCVRWIV